MKAERINGILVVPSPKTAAFKGHEKTLLSSLREACQRDQKFGPLDEAKALRDLTQLAKWYFDDQERPQTIPAAERIKRLRKFANALGSARRTAGSVQGLGYELAGAEIAEKNIPLLSRAGRDAGIQALATINKMIASLAVLERLARKASENVRPKRGRPKGGSVLSVNYLNGLGWVFKKSTGRKPSIAEGPFARFVRVFLTAIGQGGQLSNDYVVEMIASARDQTRDDPVLWAKSAFNPNGGNNSVRFS